MPLRSLYRVLAAVLIVTPVTAFAADDCQNRGELGTNYCDEDKNLIAEAPKDKAKWKDPNTLVFAYTPIEDPAVYANLFQRLHRIPRGLHAEESGVLHRAKQRRADRGDALRSSAYRGARVR